VGTLPTMIPIALEIASIHLYFNNKQNINNIIPQTTAIIEIKTVKPLISFDIGVSDGSADAAKFAI
jgi:hypothetical protein